MTPQGTQRLFRAALSTLYYARAHKIAGPFTRGVGQILMLHHVRPETAGPAFAPNRLLSVTPAFLENVIGQVRDAGFDIVSLDEAHDRLQSGERSRPSCWISKCSLTSGSLPVRSGESLEVFE